MLTAILAISDDGVIGLAEKNALPWRLRPDLERFKQLTTGHAVIMGRKTYDSIGKPLPNRTNIMLSRLLSGSPHPDVYLVTTPVLALELARLKDATPFVIGGAEIYRAMWRAVERVELTEVHTTVGRARGNVVTFDFDRTEWRETARSERRFYIANADTDPLDYTFVTLERR